MVDQAGSRKTNNGYVPTCAYELYTERKKKRIVPLVVICIKDVLIV